MTSILAHAARGYVASETRQVAENVTRFRLPLPDALAMPNLRTVGAGPITMERGFPESTLNALRARTRLHDTLEHVIGFGAAVCRAPNTGQQCAAADPRHPAAVMA